MKNFNQQKSQRKEMNPPLLQFLFRVKRLNLQTQGHKVPSLEVEARELILVLPKIHRPHKSSKIWSVRSA